jgi:hypothetical protein
MVILMSDMDVNGTKLRTITAQESDFNCVLLSKNEMKGFAGAVNPNAKGKTKDDRELEWYRRQDLSYTEFSKA